MKPIALGAQQRAILRADFAAHLRSQRGLSEHTVRAYLGDLADLFGYAERHGRATLDAIDLALLRGWLAAMAAKRLYRATMARRSAAVRTFFAWAVHTGLLDVDPTARLATARTTTHLPAVLRQADVAALLDSAAGVASADPDPVGYGSTTTLTAAGLPADATGTLAFTASGALVCDDVPVATPTCTLPSEPARAHRRPVRAQRPDPHPVCPVYRRSPDRRPRDLIQHEPCRHI